MPSILANKPIAAALDNVSLLGLLSLLQLGACPGRHPAGRTGGIGTGAAIAAVLGCAPADKP